MRVAVVGGAGAMGRVAAWDLSRAPGVEAVTVADLDPSRAEEVAADLSVGASAEVRGVGADVTSASFPEAIGGHDVCIASVDYRLNVRIAEACLAAGCHYVDLGGLFHVTRELLSMDERFREAGLVAVTGMGGAPGLTNLLAALGARELDQAQEIHVRLGSDDPSIRGLPLPIPYSLETLLDEFTKPAFAYRDGDWQEVPPLGEPEDTDYGPPLGVRRSYTTLHSEVATLPLSFPAAREVTFKIALEPDMIDRFRLLAAVGLASTEPIRVRDVEVRPRDVLVALGRSLPQAAGTDDVDCLRVELRGTVAGMPRTVVAQAVVRPNAEAGVGGGAADTGFPPSIVAQMISSGEVERRGVVPPEVAIDVDRFFERLAPRGIRPNVTVR